MKISNKLITLAIYTALSSHQSMQASFNDDFENDFIQQMHVVEKNMQDMQKNMESSFNRLSQDLRSYKQDVENNAKNVAYQTLQIPTAPQTGVTYYQQNSSALSFSNAEKIVAITEQKSTDKTVYIIDVTNRKSESSELNVDNVTALKALQTYMQKAFRAKQADKILQDCINTISHEHKNKLVNISVSSDENKKTYTIEITRKEDLTDAPIKETPAKEISKKKHKKATKNS